MTKLSIKKNRITRPDVEKTKAVLMLDEMLADKAVRLPVDVHPILNKRVKQLSDEAINPEPSRNNVTKRMIVTEALMDLFKKYANGEGDYLLEDAPPWLHEYADKDDDQA